MTNILWISRHALSTEQLDDLRRIYGEIAITQHADNVARVADLRGEIDAADVIAAVLPVNLLADLLRAAGGKPVIRARMRRTLVPATDGGEPTAVMAFEAWEQVLRVEVETVDL